MLASRKVTCASQRSCIRPIAPCRRAPVVTASLCNGSSFGNLMADLSKDQLKANPPVIRVGDSVRVGLAVTEGKGKTRTQKLEGVIIAESGSGIDKTFVLRRVFQGVGIEFNLHVHSPIVQYVETFRVGKVRRAKLHYLRDRIGKAAKLKEIVGKNKVSK